jgi:Flp pilus assembly protein TadG
MIRRRGERGSASLFYAVLALAFFMVIGLVVDGAGAIKATQQADQIAAQAARQAGQQLDATSLIQGTKAVTVDPVAARVAAEKYIAAAGATGAVSVSGDKIRITVQTQYHPLFLSAVGIGSLTADGSAEISSTRVTKS